MLLISPGKSLSFWGELPMTAKTKMASQSRKKEIPSWREVERSGFRLQADGRNVARNPLISLLATYTTVAASNS
jgi:hypothetical protein